MTEARARRAGGITDDAFLGGRIRLRQPARGYRAGLDAVMLAAAVPARPGERVVEAGCGVGAAALCLVARVEGLSVTGLDIDAGAIALARDNAARNGLTGRARFETCDLARPGAAMRALGLQPASFDHAFANPPYHARASSRAPAEPSRARAHVREPGLLEAWMRFLTGLTRSRGTITLILPAGLIGEALALFGRRAGGVAVLPLHPRAGAPAGRIVVQGVKGSRAAPRLLPGLVLHRADGAPSTAAEAILRAGAAVTLGGEGG